MKYTLLVSVCCSPDGVLHSLASAQPMLTAITNAAVIRFVAMRVGTRFRRRSSMDVWIALSEENEVHVVYRPSTHDWYERGRPSTL
jgi:hypothetical protein